MLRLNLGDLLTWQDEDCVVAAARPNAAILRRLTDNETVWVDVPTLADEFVVTDRAEQYNARENAPALAAISESDMEPARWWVPHLNEVLFGVPDSDDPTAVPRPGYGPGSSKQDREDLKVRELTAAGHKASVRSLQRKQQQYEKHGDRGLIDRRALTGSSGAPRSMTAFSRQCSQCWQRRVAIRLSRWRP